MKIRSDASKLYFWRGCRLFVTSSRLAVRSYFSGWDQLIISLGGNIRVKCSDGTSVFTRTCVTKSGTPISQENVNINGSSFAVYYLNPLSYDYQTLKGKMSPAVSGIHYGHPNEVHLIKRLELIRNSDFDARKAYSCLSDIIIPQPIDSLNDVSIDKRVVKTVEAIRTSFKTNVGVSDYAKRVNLSESQLEKLFKRHLGIPITKYRLRHRVGIGVLLLATGHSITEAGFASGFASTAHFSKSFSYMIGIKPSAIFLRPPYVNAYIADEIKSRLCC
jgi:AraC-like DNA-binding protein